jgi:hypothetical protein
MNVTQHFQDLVVVAIAVGSVVETVLSVVETALSVVETALSVVETVLSVVETALCKIENGFHLHGMQHFLIVLAAAYSPQSDVPQLGKSD